MKKSSVYIILFISIYSFTQENNNSLLWEISGNNLTKKSYLYGTMHVSKKIAFRLDDVFFECLQKSECIALESDPTTWLKSTYETRMLNNNSYRNPYFSNFYENLFVFPPVEEMQIRNSIRFDNRMINGYLYRKNSNLNNFEEDTYIDMFIFQAGKKNNKQIISLENLEESRYLTTKARTKIRKKKIDSWFQKRMAKENRFAFYENVYRNRNIELLDSIGAATNSEYFRDNMLYKRNANMVRVLDSTMHKKSVFSGVGAAHLGGEKGMINMLKNKGYTVRPLTSKQTNFAKQQKKYLDNLYIKPNLKLYGTPDHFISIKSFDKLREFNYKGLKHYAALDMSNGAYLTITRHNTQGFLPNEKTITLKDIDNLLYEDIPGEIIKKEFVTKPFPGIKILNKTKNGDYQKYEIYKTPLEICIIKFGGKNDFVIKHEQEIFDSLKFKTLDSTLINHKEPFSKYTIEFPKYYISNDLSYSGNKSIQGFDGTDYYFLQESPINDTNYIEDDTFEAKQIHTSFYDKFELKEISGKQNNSQYKSYESLSKVDTTSQTLLHLKSIVKDGSYYLLGYSGKDSIKARRFFNSFKFSNINYQGFEKQKDTALNFTVNTTVKPSLSNIDDYYKKTKPYEEQHKHTAYTSKANEKIEVTRKKYHDLKMFHNIDSLWSSFKHKKKNPFFKFIKEAEIKNEKKYKKEDAYIYEYTLKDSTSSKAIYIKKILKKGVVFQLKTLIDTIAKPSKFITEFYNSFSPIDTLLGASVLKDKTNQFFSALKKNDSIVLKAKNLLIFKDSNSKELINIINNFEFPEDKKQIKTYLVYELGQLNDPTILPYLRRLYEDSYSNPGIQIAILKTLVAKNNAISYQAILDLMQIDLPLNKSKTSIFNTKKNSLELKKNLFPELLNYITITEYKNPIYKLLAQLVENDIIKPKKYKKYLKQINNDAKIELKRNLGSKKSSYYPKKNITLDNYVKLLFPYKKDKNIDGFFTKLLKTKDYNALTTYYVLLKKQEHLIPNNLKEIVENTINAQALLIEKLNKKDLLSKNYKKIISQQQYAKSKLFANIKLKETDSILFISKKEIKTDTNKDVVVYFFKLNSISSYGEFSKLYYISFIKSKTESLITEVYYKNKRNGISLNEVKSESEFLKDALKLIKHRDRPRINRYYFTIN